MLQAYVTGFHSIDSSIDKIPNHVHGKSIHTRVTTPLCWGKNKKQSRVRKVRAETVLLKVAILYH